MLFWKVEMVHIGEVYVFMGPPEAGKTEQAKRLTGTREWPWFWDEEILAQLDDPAHPWDTLEQMIGRVHPHVPVVLDGLVRDESDVRELLERLPRVNRRLVRVVCLHITEQESLRRITARAGKLTLKPVMRHRWREYRTRTIPAMVRLREQGLVNDIPGEGAPEEIETAVDAALSGPPSDS